MNKLLDLLTWILENHESAEKQELNKKISEGIAIYTKQSQEIKTELNQLEEVNRNWEAEHQDGETNPRDTESGRT